MGVWVAISNVRRHSLGRNAVALTVMQAANYIAPLMVVPYLTRTLGEHEFGAVAVTLAVIQFAYVITDYGFTLSATRDIALHSEDKEYISKKIGVVWGAKLPLVALSVVVLLLLPAAGGKLHDYGPYFTAAILAVCAMAFQPVWLFLGIQRMRDVTIYMVATKGLYILLVFLMVRDSSDALFVIYCWGGAQLLGLLVSVYLVLREGYGVTFPQFRECLRELAMSRQFFWSRLAAALYTSVDTIVVGTLGTTVQAAHYSVCEQVYKAGRGLTSPINTALFPYMTKHKDWSLFAKLLLMIGGILCVGCAVVGLLAAPLLGFIFGAEYAASSPVLVVFCAAVAINYFGVAFGYSAFSALGKVHIANISVIAGAIAHIGIVGWLYITDSLTPVHMALAVFTTETFVMAFRLYFIIKYLHAPLAD